MSQGLFARSEAEPVDPSVVQFYVHGNLVAQYFDVAAATILIYNASINMDKEVKYFWFQPWNSIQLIYFGNLYVGLLGSICNIISDGSANTSLSCLFSYWTASIAGGMNIILIDYIFLVRVLAFYRRDKTIAICLKTFLALEAVVCLGLMIYLMIFEQVSLDYISNGLSACGGDRNPPLSILIISWGIPTSYGLILLGLALYKSAEYWKMSTGFKGFHLVKVILQDQVFYYGYFLFCCITKILYVGLPVTNPFVQNMLAVSGSPTLLSVLGCQLLINLKEAGERGVSRESTCRTSVSDMQFS